MCGFFFCLPPLTDAGITAGTVKSRAEMAKVVEAARRVERVKGVKNELKIPP